MGVLRSEHGVVSERVGGIVSGVESPMWTLWHALKTVNDLTPALQSIGCGIGITGGVLRNGTSDHDLDVVIYPLNSTKPPSLSMIHRTLQRSGCELSHTA